MTSEHDDNRKVAEALYLTEVKGSELLLVFLSFFKQARGLPHSVVRYGSDPDGRHIDVVFDDEGRIQRVISALNHTEIATLSDRIKETLIENQREAVAQTICFSTHDAVRGTYRYRDVFQIIPIPSNAAHAPVIIADHPLILQFKYVSSPDPTINSRRRAEKTAKLTRTLGIICRPPIFPHSRYTRFFWSTSFDAGITANWLQEGYGYDGFTPELPDFSDPPGFKSIRRYPSDEYYSERFMTADYELALPDIIDEYLEKVFCLGAEDARKFAIASTWIAQVPALWMESSSAAFVAVASAVEALLEKKSETCTECGQPKFGVSKKFRAFLEEYVPNVRTKYPQELKQIYRIRSDLAHGADLLLADLECWNFYEEPRQAWQDAVQRNTHNIGATAVLNWLLRR